MKCQCASGSSPTIISVPARDFRVAPVLTAELSELSCDRALLEEMCRISGGRFFREDEADRLPAYLQPLNLNRVAETETALWLSYWWFVPIVVVLGCEWLIRKRTGYV